MQVQPSLTEDRVVVKAGDAIITVWWDEDVLCVGVLEGDQPDIRVYPSEYASPTVRHSGSWQ
jgi:hypothetical protein